MSNKNLTFWQLINKHRIEIPIIQRDYAQGRDNTKSNDIRIRFIEQIKKSLTPKGEYLHLNFVYGKVNGIKNAKKIAENKSTIQTMLNAVQSYSKNMDLNVFCEIKEQAIPNEGIHQTSFVPLDGQQRLTTLYLLHWFLMPSTEENLTILKNFSYRIRPSSKDFCTALTENHGVIKKRKPITAQLRDSSWFFSYWEKDPTVKGMLKMLDEIYLQFKDEENLKSYWEYLTIDNRINFEFLNLDDYNLTNELYVKMNARGKPLTSFENFKAWLIELVERKEKENNFVGDFITINDWKLLFDTKWTDLFWNNKDDKNMLVDEEYMRFFRNMGQIFSVKNNDFIPDGKSNRDELLREKITLLTTKGIDDEYKYIPNNYFEELVIVDDNNIEPKLKVSIFKQKEWNETFLIINTLSNSSYGINIIEEHISSINFFSKHSLFKSFISGVMTYPDKARFYGLSLYLIKSQNDLYHPSSIKSWMRIVRNLIQNTAIEDISSFSRVIRSLDKLSNNCINIIEYLANDGIVSGFYGPQIKEEKRKARLIHEDVNWEDVLLDTENHPLFKGKIAFLLIESHDLESFKKRKDCAKEIFYKEYRENYLLVRAILAKSNISGDIRLLNTEANWLKLLDVGEVQNAVNKVITDLIPENNYEEALNLIISNYNNKSPLWRYYIIKHENILNSTESQTKKIQRYDKVNVFLYNKERWNNNDKQYLLSNYRNELIALFLDKENNYIKDTEFWDGHALTFDDTSLIFYRGWRNNFKKHIGSVTFSIDDEQFELHNALLTIEFAPNDIYFGLRYNNNKIEKLENHSNKNKGWLVCNELSNLNTIFDLNVDDNYNILKLEINECIETLGGSN
jgi:hypothetical protein